MSNSTLVQYTKLSPNYSGKRTHKIDTVSVHCMAGNLSVEQCGALFADSSRKASSNYGIGSDGRIALYVDEGNRSWCTSSSSNDNRAVTIEVANNGGADEGWPVSKQAWNALIALLADICRRNGIAKLLWKGDKGLIGQVDKQNMTVHRWFASKACPGDYLYSRHGQIAAEVNRKLSQEDDETMTQEQFNQMMAAYEKSKAQPVPDSTPADWEKEGVEWATENGIMAGNGSGNLMLHSSLTRAQFCVMLQRYHERKDRID